MIEKIRKALLSEEITLSNHTITRMNDRGYMKGDLANCIMTGHIRKHQNDARGIKYCIAGFDLDFNPIVLFIAPSNEGFHIITVMPPHDDKKFDQVIWKNGPKERLYENIKSN